MKLLNQSIKYLSVSMLFIIGAWAVMFYFSMLDEIKESVDEGLENYKRQIITKVQNDSTVLSQTSFDNGFFAIREINPAEAVRVRDKYIDTLIYMQDADDEALELEPVRMLTTAFSDNGHYYELTIINSMVEEDDLIEELLWEAVWLYVILIVSVVIINNVILRRLWKPFYHFLQQLKNYRLGSSKNLPNIKTETKEFVDLQRAVNTLLQHSLKTYDQQKQFTGNASHELQTPLAIATNKLELLVEKGNLEESQAESIGEVLHIIERLVRLNKSLLLLTKIETKQFFDNQEIALNAIVRQSVKDLEEMAAFKHVELSVGESAELSVQMDASLATVVISNLLRNAIFHNVPNGKVDIAISENKVLVTNTGKSKALQADKIFGRFYKSDDEPAGTGLGLAIVKAICDLYGFGLSYQYKGGRHCFEVQFSQH